MDDLLKIEVFNHLEKALYKTLPTELPVSSGGDSEGWFHFHKNIWHPIGIVKSSAVSGKVSKKDVVTNSNWNVQMVISVRGEHSSHFDPCTQITQITSNNAYWFRGIVPHMDCTISMCFSVVDDDSIAPLEHIIKVGTGLLVWPPESSAEEQESQSVAASSPKKNSSKAPASTPQTKSTTIIAIAPTPTVPLSSRKRTRTDFSLAENDTDDENEEKTNRASRTRRTTVEVDISGTSTTRKRRQEETSDITEDEEDAIVSTRSSRHSTQQKIPVSPLVKKQPKTPLPVDTQKKLASTPRGNQKNQIDLSPSSSARKAAPVSSSKVSNTVTDNATLLAEAKLYFATLRSVPELPALVLKYRLDIHTNLSSLPMTKEKERDVLMLHGPLMTQALPWNLVQIFQRDTSTTHQYIVALLQHYFTLLSQSEQSKPATKKTLANVSDNQAELTEIDQWMRENIMSPSVHSLFDRLGPRCIGLNQGKVILKHLRVLFEEAAISGALFMTTEDCGVDEKASLEQWRDLHHGNAYPWAMLLGPQYFLRFLLFVIKSANHPLGKCPVLLVV